jgi:hypothetical protein
MLIVLDFRDCRPDALRAFSDFLVIAQGRACKKTSDQTLDALKKFWMK